MPYPVVSLVVVPVWLASLAIGGAYDRSLLGSSTDEYSKVATVAAALLTIVCAASFLGSVALSRGLVAIFFPSLIVVGVTGRFVVRKALHRRRGTGRDLRRVVVVGDRGAATHLNEHLSRACFAGYRVVGAYVPGGAVDGLDDDPAMPPVLGQPDQLVADLDTIDIDAIAVTGQGLFQSESLRSLAWRLHGTGIQLLMAPDLVDIAGPRIVSRPAGGLPMLLVEEPRTTGPAQLVKTVTERLIAMLALALLLPVFLTAALLVKLTSRGPVLFRQARVGRDGRIFEMLKFRSMVEDAHQQRGTLADQNEHDGPLFKIKDDPRVTPVGRRLRRYSIDELPQLWNVVRGDMALIGPRPPLPDEVALYGGDIARRLMVKPGITGSVAGQRSGRHLVDRGRAPRPLLRRELVADDGSGDHRQDGQGRARRLRRLLMLGPDQPAAVARARVAIAHDYLTQRGGAERVVLALQSAFPSAAIHTTVYDREGTYESFRRAEVVTSRCSGSGRSAGIHGWHSRSSRRRRAGCGSTPT